jgi:hypothetical protein
MARTASIILTKEDKKAKLAELNESIKTVKADLKATAAEVKENDIRLKAATKEHTNVAKFLEKQAAKCAKDLAAFEDQKAALTATSDAPVSTLAAVERTRRTRRTKAEMEAARAAAA